MILSLIFCFFVKADYDFKSKGCLFDSEKYPVYIDMFYGEFLFKYLLLFFKKIYFLNFILLYFAADTDNGVTCPFPDRVYRVATLSDRITLEAVRRDYKKKQSTTTLGTQKESRASTSNSGLNCTHHLKISCKSENDGYHTFKKCSRNNETNEQHSALDKLDRVRQKQTFGSLDLGEQVKTFYFIKSETSTLCLAHWRLHLNHFEDEAYAVLAKQSDSNSLNCVIWRLKGERLKVSLDKSFDLCFQRKINRDEPSWFGGSFIEINSSSISRDLITVESEDHDNSDEEIHLAVTAALRQLSNTVVYEYQGSCSMINNAIKEASSTIETYLIKILVCNLFYMIILLVECVI